MSKLLRWFDLSAGLRWWGRGLLLWLPAGVRRALAPTPTRLVLEVHPDELLLSEEKNNKKKDLDRYPRSALADGSLRLPRLHNRQLVLRLDAQQVLSKVTTLPLAAENNLRQVVGFEIDRLTPFTADKLYYDASLVERQPAERKLAVRLTVVLRQAVDSLLQQLKQVGVTPDVVDVSGSERLNLLPPELRPRRGATARGLRWLLLLLLTITATGLALIPLWQQRNIAVQLLPQVEVAQQQAEKAVALRTQLEAVVESSQFLLQKRNNRIPVIELLNELTVILPDHTWVEQLIIKNGELQMRGQSRDATALIGIVEASRYFGQATFRSPVTPDRRTGADRFFLTAQIVPGVAVEQTASAADPS